MLKLMLTGRLDLAGAPGVERDLDRAARLAAGLGASLLVVDLGAVELIDGTGVRLLLEVEDRVRLAGGRLAVRSDSGVVRARLGRLGLVEQPEVIDGENAPPIVPASPPGPLPWEAAHDARAPAPIALEAT